MSNKCEICNEKIEPAIKIALKHKTKEGSNYTHHGFFCKKHAIMYLECVDIVGGGS